MIPTFASADAPVASTGYDPHGKRDPFVPLVTGKAQESAGFLGIETIDQVLIEGVVYDPKNGSVVIINGTVLKEGEVSGNVRVVRVVPDGVTLAVNGVEGFKPMYQESAVPKENSQ